MGKLTNSRIYQKMKRMRIGKRNRRLLLLQVAKRSLQDSSGVSIYMSIRACRMLSSNVSYCKEGIASGIYRNNNCSC